jgi:hypothetical protein
MLHDTARSINKYSAFCTILTSYARLDVWHFVFWTKTLQVGYYDYLRWITTGRRILTNQITDILSGSSNAMQGAQSTNYNVLTSQ